MHSPYHMQNKSSRRQIMLILKFIILFWFTTWLNAFLILSCAAALYFSSETHCFNSCLFQASLLNTQSAPIGHLTHAWASTANSNRAAVLNNNNNVILMCQTSYQAVIMWMYESLKWRDVTKSQK